MLNRDKKWEREEEMSTQAVRCDSRGGLRTTPRMNVRWISIVRLHGERGSPFTVSPRPGFRSNCGFYLRRTQARREVAYTMNNLTTFLCCFIEKGCLGHFF